MNAIFTFLWSSWFTSNLKNLSKIIENKLTMTLVSVLTTLKAAHLILNTRFGSRFLKRSLILSSAIACHFPSWTLSLNTQAWETLLEKTGVKNSSVSASSVLAATNFPVHSAQVHVFPVYFCSAKAPEVFLSSPWCTFFLLPQHQVCFDLSEAIPMCLDNVSTFFS